MLSLRLKKRIMLRILLMILIAIVQRLTLIKFANSLLIGCEIFVFAILVVGLAQSLNTFIKFSQNKITFRRIGKYFRIRLLDSKLDSKVGDATHYFKETFYCRILVNLDHSIGGDEDRKQ